MEKLPDSPADNSASSSPRLLSPGIQTDKSEAAWLAFELKFVLSEDAARSVERWAREHLEVDPYSDLRTGMYQTTTLYLDTPGFDVLRRTAGFRRRKFRLRRYGEDSQIHLERKTRTKDQVRKRRYTVPAHELDRLAGPEVHHGWNGDWFHQRLIRRELRPACRVTYHRAAFMKLGATGVMRLTLDHRILGVPTNDWGLEAVHQGNELLPGQVVCELKFRDTMPALFKQLVADQRLAPGSVSKYRRLMQAHGHEIPAETPGNEPGAASSPPCADGEALDARSVR